MKNNTGFTLIELIIAISIMSMVIGLGYNVINKTISATQDQNKVSSSQLNANLINKYLTKDLESCKTFEGPEESNLGQEYEFIINKGNNEITYKVLIEKKGNQEIYNLTRISNGSEIDLITNQTKVSKTPFFISKKEGYNDLYVVQLDSSKELLGKYQFEVASRVLVSSSEDVEIPVSPEPDDSEDSNQPIEPPIPPDVIVPGKPDDEFEVNKFFQTKFWVKDSNNSNVEMGFLHPKVKSNGNQIVEYKQFMNVTPNSDNRYKITIEMPIFNSGNQNNMCIDNGNQKIGSDDKFQVVGLDKGEVDQIVIEVNEGTQFELLVNNTIIVPNSLSGEKILLKTGKYKFYINKSSNTFIVKGSIIKNTKNSEVKIYYGKSK